jgi:hypothetical protein
VIYVETVISVETAASAVQPSAARRIARVDRTLLSDAFDFAFDLDSNFAFDLEF